MRPHSWGDTPDGGSYLNVFPLYDRRCESDGIRSNRLLLGLLGGHRIIDVFIDVG